MPSVRRLVPTAALALVAGGAVAQASDGASTTPRPAPAAAMPVTPTPGAAVSGSAPAEPAPVVVVKGGTPQAVTPVGVAERAPVVVVEGRGGRTSAPVATAKRAPVVVVEGGAPRAVVAPGGSVRAMPVPSSGRRIIRATPRAAPAPVDVQPSLTPAPPGVAILPSLATPTYVTGSRPIPACKPSKSSAAPAPPSDALKDAFAILRRDRNDDDTLPAAALKALKRSLLSPVDPQSARLLRADGAARAWVVPVPDVDAGSPLRCAKGAVAREGLAVVSVGGAAAGGGGALRDLLRGIAPASVDPCAGTEHDMLGVSGVVPDDVEAVFITAADGTATRADVHDNGYTFVLPRNRRLESRYLVWSSQDGTPHVQPLATVPLGSSKTLCRAAASAVRVTPVSADLGCGPFGTVRVGPGQPFALAPGSIPQLPRGAAARRAAARRAAARRTAARRKAGRSKPARRAPAPAYYTPIAVCAPSALATVVQVSPKSGRILSRSVAPRIAAPTVTTPAPRGGKAPTVTRPEPRVKAPTAITPAPRGKAPTVTTPAPRGKAPTATTPAPAATVPAKPKKTRTTP